MTHPSIKYAEDVLSGQILACRWVKLACERFLDDLEHGHERGLHFDEAAADHALEFFSLLKLWKGREYKNKEFVLGPHYQFIVSNLMGWKNDDGTRRFRTAYVEMARKGAKALGVDTLVPTPSGWTTVGKIVVGDRIFDENGNVCRVVSTTPVFENRKCYRVEFSDGETIVADSGHLWETIARRKFEGRKGPRGSRRKFKDVRTTAEIKKTIEVSPYNKKIEWNHKIKVSGPLKTKEKRFAIEPYTLGSWLGDGHTGAARITFSGKDSAIIREIIKDGYGISGWAKTRSAFTVTIGAFKTSSLCRRGHDKAKYRTKDGHCLLCNRECDTARRNGTQIPPHTKFSLAEKLRQMNLIGNKHIPAAYLRGSRDQRLSLLQGLMDTDGTIDDRGQSTFVSTNKAVATGVFELVRTLGLKPSYNKTKAKLYQKDCGTAHRVKFTAYSDTPVFRLRRKYIKQRRPPSSPNRSSYRQIVSVRRVASVPVRCISVDSTSKLFLVTKAMIATHNSTFAGGLGAFMFVADGEDGAEIYSAAVKKEQAKIVWNNIKNLTKKSIFSKLIKYYTNNMSIESTWSKCEPLSSDTKSLDGLDTSFASLDELHAHPTPDVHDLVDDSVGARSQPLILIITTAGFDQEGICYQRREYLTRILKGLIEDDTFFGMIFTLDTKKDWPELQTLTSSEPGEKEDDWQDEENWIKAMPGLCGITKSGKRYGIDENGDPVPGYMTKLDDVRKKATYAAEVPAAQNNFLTKRMNIWTQQATRWISLQVWDENNTMEIKESRLKGRWCAAGIDLSSVSDLTCCVYLFPRDDDRKFVDVLMRCWCPEARLTDKKNKYKEQYQSWNRNGHLLVTPGEIIDYDFVRKQVIEDYKKFDVGLIGVDYAFQGVDFITKLGDKIGHSEKHPKIIGTGNSAPKVGPVCNEFERRLIGRKINHGGNPVLRFMADSVCVRENADGYKKPDKDKSQGKIDGIVAMLYAMDRLMRSKPKRKIMMPAAV